MAGSETKSGAASGVGSGLGTITDSLGNVFRIIRVLKKTPPIDVDRFKQPGAKHPSGNPVGEGTTGQWFSSAPFSLVFDTPPDLQAPQKIFFQATKAPGQRRWRAYVDFSGHKFGTQITYKIFSPESKEEIDPSLIVVDPWGYEIQ